MGVSRGLCRLSSGEGPGLEDNLGVVSLGDIYSPGSDDITSWHWAQGGRLSSCLPHPTLTPTFHRTCWSPGVRPTGPRQEVTDVQPQSPRPLDLAGQEANSDHKKRIGSVHLPRRAAGLPGCSWPSCNDARPATGQPVHRILPSSQVHLCHKPGQAGATERNQWRVAPGACACRGEWEVSSVLGSGWAPPRSLLCQP